VRRNSLCLDALQHLSRRLPDAQRAPPKRTDERRRDRACARKQPGRGWVRAIPICGEEGTAGIAQKVLERLGKLGIIYRGVEPTQDCANSGVGLPVLEAEWNERVVFGVLRSGCPLVYRGQEWKCAPCPLGMKRPLPAVPLRCQTSPRRRLSCPWAASSPTRCTPRKRTQSRRSRPENHH
jgi:hypothetical protein